MRALTRLLLILLVPLVIVMFVRDPQAVVHLVQTVFNVGAKMLVATADFLNSIFSSL